MSFNNKEQGMIDIINSALFYVKAEVRATDTEKIIPFGKSTIPGSHDSLFDLLTKKGFSRHHANIIFSEHEVRLVPVPGKNKVFCNGEEVGFEGVVIEPGLQFKTGNTIVWEFEVDLAKQSCIAHSFKIVSEPAKEAFLPPQVIALPKVGTIFLGSDYLKKLGLDQRGVLEKHVLFTARQDSGQEVLTMTVLPGAKVRFYGMSSVLVLEGAQITENPTEDRARNDVIDIQDGDVIQLGKSVFVFSAKHWRFEYVSPQNS